MDYQKFIEELPKLSPSPDFQEIINKTQGITSANKMQLLNLAVSCLETDEIYCQINCDEGTNLIGALLNNPEKNAYVVDNSDPEKIEQLSNKLSKFNLEEQIIFCHQDFEEFFFDLKEYQPETKIGVYFYTNSDDYRSQLLALLLVRPFLADQALIIINNKKSIIKQQASWDFLAIEPRCNLYFQTDKLQIFTWDIQQNITYTWSEFASKCRHEAFIKAIFNFHCKSQENIKQLYQEALSLAAAGNLTAATEKYQEILKISNNHAPSLHDLGMIYYQMSEYQQAQEKVLQALKINPNIGSYYYSLGLILERLGQKKPAIEAYQKAITLQPQLVKAYNNLGNIYYLAGNLEAAAEIYRQEIAAKPDYFGGYFNLIGVLNSAEKIQEAIKVATTAANQFPDDLLWKIKQYLILPLFYQNQAEIEQYRQQFTQGLDRLIQEVNLNTPEARENALKAIANNTNFGLAYQGFNHKKLQQKYGELVQRIMAANFPQLTNQKPKKNPNKNKIKVGYMSGCMRDHVVTKLTQGWLLHHDKTKFDIYSYYIDGQPDKLTELFQKNSTIFRHIPHNLETISQQVITDELDILVFLDIGMLPKMTLLASLKLAPIQCTTWAHPETSGISTIDYFLSSDLMEPENAQHHYSEELIRLPNIAFSYPKPHIPQPTKTRANFNLPDDAVVYFCCQSLFKYLPQHDYILANIAQKVPTAQFVFINRPNVDIALLFRKRLQGAFAQLKLNFDEYSVFLPSLNREDYLNLNLVSDIYLDSLNWSGGNTTLEAIACNLPVVTYPGEFMRGRHSYGILKMLGVTDTIATSETEYIHIAARLGNNPQWRQNIVEKIKANHSNLYDDTECVRSLEEFYQNVINKKKLR